MSAKSVDRNCTFASVKLLALVTYTRRILTVCEVVVDSSPVIARLRFPGLVFFLVCQLVKLLFLRIVAPRLREDLESSGL
jgi:hypothetical protein